MLSTGIGLTSVSDHRGVHTFDGTVSGAKVEEIMTAPQARDPVDYQTAYLGLTVAGGPVT
jgi:hypothetical protein